MCLVDSDTLLCSCECHYKGDWGHKQRLYHCHKCVDEFNTKSKKVWDDLKPF